MDNHYLNLSAGESIYYGSSTPAVSVLHANQPSTPIAPPPPPVQLRRAGRKPLDETGRAISGQKTALRLQRKLQARAERQAARAAETQRKKDQEAAHRQRKAEAVIQREKDTARANKIELATVPAESIQPATYQVLYVSADGTSTVKVDHNTNLQVRPGKDINEVVSRYNNRKRIIF